MQRILPHSTYRGSATEADATITEMAALLGYGMLTALVVLMAYAIIDGAAVVHEAEMAAGGSLTCRAAYGDTIIGSYYYPERSLRGNLLYASGVVGLLGIPMYLLITFGYSYYSYARVRRRWLREIGWVVVGMGMSAIFVYFYHADVLRTIACALE